MTNDIDTDVIIVGGGPVGMGLAIELAQRGVDSVVVEKHQDPSPIPKGQNLTGRTVEHFHSWGIDDQLRAARAVPREYGARGVTAYGTLLSGYHYEWLSRKWVQPYYFRGNERVPQYATERVLRERARQLDPVTTLLGWTAVEVSQHARGCELAIRETGGPARRRLRGRWLVGCDGARSTVVEQAGISQHRNPHDKRMALLVFRSPALHDLLEPDYPGVSFYCVLNREHRGYWMFFGRVDLQSWFFHAPVPDGTTRDNFDFAAYLHRAVGAPFDVEFEHIGFWDLRIAYAGCYRQGRIFIAGDAAHSHPPYGGYGINTGFEDIRNLGWKLAAVEQGWAGERLLDSYSEERQPVFRTTAEHFIEKSIRDDADFVAAYSPDEDLPAFEAAWTERATAAPDEVDAYEPNYAGSSIVAGVAGARPDARGSHRFEARAGHHLAPLALDDGRNVYDLLGRGFTLLAIGQPTSAVEPFTAAAARLGLPLTLVRLAASAELERYAARIILVRPDQFVAWAGNRPEVAADEMLRMACGRQARGDHAGRDN